jgi:hypothetical protein
MHPACDDSLRHVACSPCASRADRIVLRVRRADCARDARDDERRDAERSQTSRERNTRRRKGKNLGGRRKRNESIHTHARQEECETRSLFNRQHLPASGPALYGFRSMRADDAHRRPATTPTCTRRIQVSSAHSPYCSRALVRAVRGRESESKFHARETAQPCRPSPSSHIFDCATTTHTHTHKQGQGRGRRGAINSSQPRLRLAWPSYHCADRSIHTSFPVAPIRFQSASFLSAHQP